MLTTQKSEQDYIQQVQQDKDSGYGGKYIISFNRPVQLIQNRYHKNSFTSITVKLFFSGTTLCYTFYKRTGYALFSQISPEDIHSLEKVPQADQKAQRLRKAESLLRRIDSRCWDDLRHKTPEQISEEFCDSNLIPFTFINRFDSYRRNYLKQQMEDAFQSRKTFSYSQNGKKRDLSIETQVGKDGVFRAWFSSEYSGCANGDYYLVISPTQAIYYERD